MTQKPWEEKSLPCWWEELVAPTEDKFRASIANSLRQHLISKAEQLLRLCAFSTPTANMTLKVFMMGAEVLLQKHSNQDKTVKDLTQLWDLGKETSPGSTWGLALSPYNSLPSTLKPDSWVSSCLCMSQKLPRLFSPPPISTEHVL